MLAHRTIHCKAAGFWCISRTSFRFPRFIGCYDLRNAREPSEAPFGRELQSHAGQPCDETAARSASGHAGSRRKLSGCSQPCFDDCLRLVPYSVDTAVSLRREGGTNMRLFYYDEQMNQWSCDLPDGTIVRHATRSGLLAFFSWLDTRKKNGDSHKGRPSRRHVPRTQPHDSARQTRSATFSPLQPGFRSVKSSSSSGRCARNREVETQQNSRSSSTRRRSSVPFASYDNARFVVFLGDVADGRPLRGTARFQRDDTLGNILRISLDEAGPGSPAIIVTEKEWDGVITPDFRHGVDYCLILSSDWQADKNRSPDEKENSSERF